MKHFTNKLMKKNISYNFFSSYVSPQRLCTAHVIATGQSWATDNSH